MATFELSAFADEYSPVFDEQIIGLKANNVKYMEIRGVDGKNISEITYDEAKTIKQKLDGNGIKVSAVGSPIGKIGINAPFEPHLELLKHIIELANILSCDRIRMFSFFIPKGENADDYRSEVMDKLGKMLDIAKASNVILCHENESVIYGDTALRCLDIQKEFDGEIKLVFDHANFIHCGEEPYPYAFDMLKDYIYYMHIKDCNVEKIMAPAGMGIGRIPETIESLKAYDHKYFLTIEPHLQIFKGLEKLDSSNQVLIENQYATSADAFKAAVDAMRNILNSGG
ncbi:MAG: sugar phosphate isomerase/epimerase [Oscillospiraceae bacterium]|nr:sugar phosphate isomerase/epimerase [Oscillospiraceae bacterium]